MPHRTTYFFPRQFPERGLDESSIQLLDHEKKKIVNSIKSDTFSAESDQPKKPLSHSTPTKDDVVVSSGKHSAVSDLFAAADKFRTKHKPIAAFCDSLIDKKVNRFGGHHIKPYVSKEERDLLRPETAVKDTAVDQSFDWQVSLLRLSSGSSYAGSLFSGTKLDGNFSSDIKDETSSSRLSTKTITTILASRQKE